MIYILLPVHNRRAMTAQFIACLRTQTTQDYHLILLDDGSADATAEMVRAEIDPGCLTVLQGKGDWWWAGALQAGLDWLKRQEARPNDIVLTINDDTTFAPDFLETGRRLLDENPDTLLLPCGYSARTGRHLTSGIAANIALLRFRETLIPEEINCLPTRGLFMRWEDALRVGDYRPKLLPHYLSDYEYTMRAYRKGLKLVVPPEFRLYFQEEETGPSGFEGMPLRKAFRSLWTNKQQLNPIRRTVFICLISRPLPFIPLNIARVWASAFAHLGIHALKLAVLSAKKKAAA